MKLSQVVFTQPVRVGKLGVRSSCYDKDADISQEGSLVCIKILKSEEMLYVPITSVVSMIPIIEVKKTEKAVK